VVHGAPDFLRFRGECNRAIRSDQASADDFLGVLKLVQEFLHFRVPVAEHHAVEVFVDDGGGDEILRLRAFVPPRALHPDDKNV
jgi:hypothetical protein